MEEFVGSRLEHAGVDTSKVLIICDDKKPRYWSPGQGLAIIMDLEKLGEKLGEKFTAKDVEVLARSAPVTGGLDPKDVLQMIAVKLSQMILVNVYVPPRSVAADLSESQFVDSIETSLRKLLSSYECEHGVRPHLMACGDFNIHLGTMTEWDALSTDEKANITDPDDEMTLKQKRAGHKTVSKSPQKRDASVALRAFASLGCSFTTGRGDDHASTNLGFASQPRSTRPDHFAMSAERGGVESWVDDSSTFDCSDHRPLVNTIQLPAVGVLGALAGEISLMKGGSSAPDTATTQRLSNVESAVQGAVSDLRALSSRVDSMATSLSALQGDAK
ncbi:hypothetical protein FOA52_004431 [Chlamydomonas sp. UWO 241]|nr:hypothetical protein FOA52_004431 [Chlamydomonas sp. UWO 241]